MSDDFAVRCKACGFQWNTPAMADGLRVLGSCPKCKGELEFGTRGAPAAESPAQSGGTPVPEAAPHMVLGIPRL